MRVSVPRSAAASSAAMCSRSQSSQPADRAASSASTAAAARPLQNTLRRSFLVAAAPRAPASTSTVAPHALSMLLAASAPGPEATIGVCRPRPGTGAMMATSANDTPASSARLASRCLRPAAAGLACAYTAVALSPGSACRRALSACPAVVRLRPRSAPWQASTSPVADSTPGSPGTTAHLPDDLLQIRGLGRRHALRRPGRGETFEEPADLGDLDRLVGHAYPPSRLAWI